MIGLVQLGARGGGDDLVDALAACHARIRGFLDLALRLAEVPDLPATEVIEAATGVHRYFTVAFPLHVLDEDELVAPALAGGDAEVTAALATMCADHAAHRDAVAALVAACARAVRDPACRADVGAFARSARAIFEPHLTLEERVVFPAVRALPAATQTGILQAMRQRRHAPAER